jgi:hypothetical protein
MPSNRTTWCQNHVKCRSIDAKILVRTESKVGHFIKSIRIPCQYQTFIFKVILIIFEESVKLYMHFFDKGYCHTI